MGVREPQLPNGSPKPGMLRWHRLTFQQGVLIVRERATQSHKVHSGSERFCVMADDDGDDDC